jgi:hypothetical protein
MRLVFGDNGAEVGFLFRNPELLSNAQAAPPEGSAAAAQFDQL